MPEFHEIMRRTGAGLWLVAITLSVVHGQNVESASLSGLDNHVRVNMAVTAASSPDLDHERKLALAELEKRDAEEKRLRLATAVCLKAVERDSGHKRNSMWLVSDRYFQQTFFFTVKDSKSGRLFTSYHYSCDGSSDKAKITEKTLRVGIKAKTER